jgi:hypothetical protein
MADNLGVNPNPPEPMDTVEIAFKYVGDYIDEHNVDSTDEYQLLLVSHQFVLGSWKTVVISTLPDGYMYEVTYAAERGDLYLNIYQKVGVETYSNISTAF